MLNSSFLTASRIERIRQWAETGQVAKHGHVTVRGRAHRNRGLAAARALTSGGMTTSLDMQGEEVPRR